MSEKLEEKDVKNEISAFLKKCDDKGNTLLHYVVKSDDYEFAEKLISAGCDVNKRNKQGQSPLVLATLKNKLEMVKVLLKAGADYDSGDFVNKMRPLHIAACNAYPEMVQLFVQLKADVNARSDSGETALHYAVECNEETESNDRCRIIKILIDAGADVNPVDNYKSTPLTDAYCCDFNAGFELLINMGASISVEADVDIKFMIQVLEKSNLQSLKRLNEIGYDVNTSDDFGNSCLHKAAIYSESEIIEFLFDKGAVVTVNDDGSDPLCYGLCDFHEDYDFTETDDEDDDLDQKIEKDIYYQTVFIKQMKCIQTLIKYGSNVNHVTNDGDTPLYIVLRNFKYLHSDFVRILLDNGAKIDFDHPLVLRVINNSNNSKFPHLLLRHTAMFEAQNRNDGPMNFDLNKLNEKAQKEYARCRDELELMKTTKIDETNVSFFNILVNRDIGPYTRNEHITRAFESTSLVSKRFSIYGDLMCERFSKEFEFQKLVEAASNGLGYILNWDRNSTHMLLSNILSYLNRNDLTNLVEILHIPV